MSLLTLLTVVGVVQALSFRGTFPSSSPVFPSKITSSTAQLGIGLESINSNVLDISQVAASHQQSSGNHLKSILQTTKETALLLLSDQIVDKIRRTEDIRTELEELEKSVLDAGTDCGKRWGCKECTSSVNCAWCELEERCVPGGVSGPLGEVCTIYSYKECVTVECAEAGTCSACIALGCLWCENGGRCMTPEILEDRCDTDLTAFTQNQCRISKTNDPRSMTKYVPPSIPMTPIEPELAEKYRRILQLKDYENQLKADITTLEHSMETLREKRSEFDETEPADLVRIDGLGMEIEKSVVGELEEIREGRDVALEGLKTQVKDTVNVSFPKHTLVPMEHATASLH